ncbi:polyketide synthase PksN [Ruminiclostridium sufflavum DSM 19573]|uniref:Polyketide synthase PksN n=1 Tax=Ruminiclostridium sufflavum DSM 19573 TaxID=1121337 RepID=A0A318Y3G2_9FIRM|nr:SDR family NAD(P)-dependent oxidoreductase [Ruminiclostridium sufflavum]PYG86581.1 polyketide synthase PksN [Ruminiclostridium sufflavum DSM 19573]
MIQSELDFMDSHGIHFVKSECSFVYSTVLNTPSADLDDSFNRNTEQLNKIIDLLKLSSIETSYKNIIQNFFENNFEKDEYRQLLSNNVPLIFKLPFDEVDNEFLLEESFRLFFLLEESWQNLKSFCKTNGYSSQTVLISSLIAFFTIYCEDDDISMGIQSKNDIIWLEDFDASKKCITTILGYIVKKISQHNESVQFLISFKNTNVKEPKNALPDVVFSVKEEDNELICGIKYLPILTSPWVIELVLRHFKSFLENLIKNSELNIDKIGIIDNVEEEFLRRSSRGYQGDFSFKHSLYNLFEKKVKETPFSTSIVHEDDDGNVIKLSYIQLFNAVDLVASEIEKTNMNLGAIGVYGKRTVYTTISILAIFKSGNIYVPLDTTYPAEHIKYIIDDAGISLILSLEKYLPDLPDKKVKVKILDSIKLDDTTSNDFNKQLSENRSNLDSSGLIMYTSGSTGKPKGVRHRQHQLINYYNHMWKIYPFRDDDCVCQRTSMNYMPSMWEFLGGVLGGVPTVILSDSIVKDPAKLIRAIARHNISYLIMIPSVMKRMFDSTEDINLLSSIRVLIMVGEPITPEFFKFFTEKFPNALLVADYGATEVNGILQSDNSNYTKASKSMPLYSPIANVKTYVLDKNLCLCPIGVPGDLYIGGISLAVEYIKLPEENRNKFIPDPFEQGERLYKIGDMARYLSDGTIQPLGRRDNQVKIRGIRIELSAVEKVISEIDGVRENAVIAKELSTGSKRLLAFVVFYNNIDISVEKVEDLLKKKLPEYMIPSSFIELRVLPRTPNGKVDCQRLAKSDIKDLINDMEQSNSMLSDEKDSKSILTSIEDIMVRLCEIASETLGVNKGDIEIHKRFYALGFDSMTIVDFLNKINNSLNAKLEVSDLYDNSSIEDLAAFLVQGIKIKPAVNMQKPESISLQAEIERPTRITAGDTGSIREQLIEIASETLGVNKSDIEIHKKFYALGFDSMTIVDFLNKINNSLNVKLEVSDLYDNSSIEELAAFLVQGKKVRPTVNMQKPESISLQAEIERPIRITAGNTGSIREQLIEIASETLGVNKSDIEIHKKFYALGFDSMTIVDFLNKINNSLNIKLEVSDLYDNSSIEELEVFLAKENLINENVENIKNSIFVDKDSLPLLNFKLETLASQCENFSDSLDEKNRNMVAIIGISGRFPGAKDANEFWSNLASGVASITEIPSDRWDINTFYDPDNKKPLKSVSKWGGFVEGIDLFDPDFFNISPRESEFMDPQQRLCIEECWKSLEDAGYSNTDLNGKSVGVFIGAKQGDYINLIRERNNTSDPFAVMGCDTAILASRISYYLNLKGPCISIDTACSSSLVAIHVAARSILAGECDMAITGGVHLMSSPALYINSSKMNMLSIDGRCKTFDNNANGFVPGESVGIIILKRLDKAIEDRDNIQGVIIGSGINQDGKTNGITAPSAAAQVSLIKSIYEKNRINTEDISYIETHGTGTKLGDPIEFNALTEALSSKTNKKKFCAIGSVKTNIGHTVASAGVVGLIKVLLSMKNSMLPPSLNFDTPNQHINFNDTPLYVNTSLKEWNISDKKIGAVSSFGYSGTNCHVVLKEFPNVNRMKSNLSPYHLIPISARTRKALIRKVKDLAEWLAEEGKKYALEDIAYTLQKGRSHFEFRIAYVVENKSQLMEKLKLSLTEDISINNEFNENTQKIEDNLEVEQLMSRLSIKDSDKNKYKETLIRIAKLYTQNINIDWDAFNKDNICNRISMPVYPFEREHYWISEDGSKNNTIKKLHPFIDENVSTIHEQKFCTVFNKNDAFIKDHVINDVPVLPGVVLLEMALTAGKISCERDIKVIRSIVWKKPVIFDKDTKKVYIKLFPQNDALEFLIHTDDEEETSVCEGIMELESSPVREVYDIDKLKEICTGIKKDTELYRYFNENGIKYEETYRVVRKIFYNENELLAYIEAPLSLQGLQSQCTLVPQLLDGALHTVAGFDSVSALNETYLPFLIDRIEIHKPLKSSCYSHIRIHDRESAEIVKADINILNEENELLITIKDFTAKAISKKPVSMEAEGEEKNKTMFFANEWKEQTASKDHLTNTGDLLVFGEDESLAMYDKYAKSFGFGRVVVAKKGQNFERVSEGIFEIGNTHEDYAHLVNALENSRYNVTHILYLWSLQKQKEHLEYGIYSMFYLINALLKVHSLSDGIKLVYAYSGAVNDIYPFYAGVNGFAKTAVLENPNFHFKGVEISDYSRESVVPMLINELCNTVENQEIRYEQDIRKVKVLKEIIPLQDKQVIYKGLYIITGGLGGIGRVFARYILSKQDCQVVLIGRSELEGKRKIQFEKLKILNENVEYIKCDISNYNDIQAVLSKIRNQFGAIKGIFHCAGIIKDTFLIKKEKREFDEVLEPKVQGTLNLGELTACDNLDFFALFSSITSTFGNIGQCDYAYANRFMDEYASLREKKRMQGECSGRTISVNWPLWEEGGMVLSDSMRDRLLKNKGIVGLESKEGISAFEMALSSKYACLTVLSGNKAVITDMVNAENQTGYIADVDVNVNDSTDTINEGEIQKKVEKFLTQIISQETQLPVEKIRRDKQFDEYGLNSIMMLNLTDELEKSFGGLSKTLFFEYKNVEELATYFVKKHTTHVYKLFGKEQRTLPKYIETKKTQKEDRARFFKPIKNEDIGTASDISKQIAIIGVAGRYPMAESLDDFWYNLTQGKDCITEIPQDRWDYRKYFDPDKSKSGKTYTKWGGFINDIDKFDPLFFNISPKEAELMDPQERLFLETAWETLENGGYTRHKLANLKVGVFVGVMWGQYQLYGAQNELIKKPNSSYASVANRVSYVFNFNGPSMAVDSMCSSSLSALKLAADSINMGECDYALVGGVNIASHPNKYFLISQSKFGSSDGRCRSFGEGGDGYVPGEGVGAVLLKPMQQAIKDGDNIYGVIIGSAINHGGKTNGYTVPSPVAQSRLIVDCLKNAKISARTVSYIEAHGTGTSLGDPIEIDGITKAFGEFTDDKQFCSIGSLKSNIGHLESVAGIASLTKVLLQMRYKLLVPSIHSDKLNPHIDFGNSPVYVQNKLEEWKKPVLLEDGVEKTYLRRAEISSFGAGGSNASVIIEEYDKPLSSNKSIGNNIIVLSAKSEDTLKAYAYKLKEFLEKRKLFTSACTNNNEEIDELSEEDFLSAFSSFIQIERESIEKDDSISSYLINANDFMCFLSHLNEKFGTMVSMQQITYDLTIKNLYQIVLKNKANQIKSIGEVKLVPRIEAEDLSLADIAYTLQTGREPMEERLAIIAGDIEELINKLNCYINNIESEDTFTGSNYNSQNNIFEYFEENVETDNLLKNWFMRGKFRNIAKLWVTGLDIDWEMLYDSNAFSIVSLPTYPFSKESYWITEECLKKEKTQSLHPLLDSNTSTLYEQCYQKLFSQDEFCIKDHVIDNRIIVPGALVIEMARAAGVFSNRGERVRKIKNLIWLNPIELIDGSKEAKISLYQQEAAVEFEVVTEQSGAIVHAKGLLEYENQDTIDESLNIEKIKSRCTDYMGKQKFYECFSKKGISYGDGYKTVQELWYNPNESLSYIRLNNDDTVDRKLVLHPILLDGVLQSVLGLQLSSNKTKIPFSIDEIHIKDFLPENCFVHSVLKDGKYNLSVTDMAGKVILTINGFALREFNQKEIHSGNDMLYFNDYLSNEELSVKAQNISGYILAFDNDEETFLGLSEYVSKNHRDCYIIRVKCDKSFSKTDTYYKINPDNKEDYIRLLTSIDQNGINLSYVVYFWNSFGLDTNLPSTNLYKETSHRLLYLVQALQARKLKNRVKVLLSFAGVERGIISAAANAFLKSAFLESQTYEYKTLLLENMDYSVLINELFAIDEAVEEIAYISGKRMKRKFEETVLEVVQLKDEEISDGVYIITGGAGGLGLIFANYLAEKGKCSIILVGRSEIQKQEIKGLVKPESVEYIKTDITNHDEVEMLYKRVKAKYGKIDGIVHSAGVIRDSLVVNKNVRDMDQVLAPKLDGLVYLDEITKDEHLKFFVVFSSIAAVLGSRGQADYAFANRFMDMYVDMRNDMVKDERRYGPTFSINWPLWEEGGMGVIAEIKQMMEENTGFSTLSTKHGLITFDNILKSGLSRISVAEGNIEKIRQLVMPSEVDSEIVETEIEIDSGNGQDALAQKIIDYLKDIVCKITKVPVIRIREKDSFEHYGADSVMLIAMGNELAKLVGMKAQSAFIEYQNIKDLSMYLITNYKQEMIKALGVTKEPDTPHYSMASKVVKRTISREVKNLSSQVPAKVSAKDIAVIGISGRYPMAKDLNEFWNNLVEGRNCITEIPPERWDYSLFYDSDKEKEGKMCSKWGGFIQDVDKFDPLFFNISPSEAENIDPQERIMLETTWQALEEAGYSTKRLHELQQEGHNIGVFIGSMYQQYPWVAEDRAQGAILSGNSYWSIANRVSYFLGIHGPSIAVDTACSSSLSALHLAMNSLKNGECSIAIVGGVNLSLHPYKYLGLSRAKLLGSSAKSLSLSNSDGYVPGEGVGVVILKALDEAEKDNDRINCVLKASVMNHSGRTNAFKVPSVEAQRDLVLELISRANIDCETIGYYETASNGLALGDATEIEALKQAYAKLTSKKQICKIGSVKSNIGHLEAASGMSQLAKVILQLQNKTLVPSINAEVINTRIDLDHSPFQIQRNVSEWKKPNNKDEIPLRAAINSIGAGGTNVAIIVEEYIKSNKPNVTNPDGCVILMMSARTQERLHVVAQNIKEYLENMNEISLYDIAYTLSRREAMEERLAIVKNSRQECLVALENYLIRKDEELGVYSGSVETEGLYDQVIDNTQFDYIARLWIKGYDLNLSDLYRGKDCKLVSLPLYPFEKESYWLDDGKDYEEIQIKSGNDKNSVLNELRHLVSTILKVPDDRIKYDVTFDKYGMDSLTASNMVNNLSEKYGIRITLQNLFEHYSINKLNSFIMKFEGKKQNEPYDRSANYSTDIKNGTEDAKYYLENFILSCLEEGKLTPDEAADLKEINLNFVERGEGSVR